MCKAIPPDTHIDGRRDALVHHRPGVPLMRFVRDLLLLLVLIAVAAGVVYYQREQRDEQVRIIKATAETRRLEMEVKFRAAAKAAELNARGWPHTIDPGWFEKDPPVNTLVEDDLPWIEIASADEAEYQHPPVRMTVDDDTAAFWYNPYQGVVRARVPVMVSDEAATALYNRINESNMTSIFWIEPPPPTRTPPAPPAADDDRASDEQPAAEPTEQKPERNQVSVRRTTPSGARTTGRNTKSR
jgi:hypothetical protein